VKKLALTALCFACGCLPSEGGIEFSYGLFRNGSPPTAAMNCTEINVTRIRFMVGNDANRDGDLQDDELEGRAIAECNQSDRDRNEMLTGGELGSFKTASDRLPAGAYDMFAVELAHVEFDTSDTVRARYWSRTDYADRWNFWATDGSSIVTIVEGVVTRVDFSDFEGGFPELRLIVQ
jgi:hypothetical protein